MIAHSDLTRNSTLDELVAAKAEWLRDAIESGTAHKILVIGRELGLPVPDSHSKIFTIQWYHIGITVIYTCKTGQFIPERGEYKMLESCGVRIADLISGEQVMAYGHDEKDFFIPGKWVEKVLACYGAAQAAKTEKDRAATESERQKLVELLLIGKDI